MGGTQSCSDSRACESDREEVDVSTNLSKDKIALLFDSLDENKSKRLDFTEFSAIWTVASLKPNTKAARSKVFERYDENNDGCIDTTEFKKFLESLDAGRVDVGYEWGYEDENGPDTWCAHFPAANGSEQSPIDVKLNDVKDNPNLAAVTTHYKNCKAVCLNNSHTVVWSVENAGHIMIGDRKFKLAQFHYHCPSEHFIDGEQYPLCFHFVHVAEDDGTLAVLGRIYNCTNNSNSFIDAITSVKPLAMHESSDIPEIPFDKLDSSGRYVHYPGSLTTPPCSEGVLWYVKDTVDDISYAQENWFRSCLPFSTARPLQAMNGRETFCVEISDGKKIKRGAGVNLVE